MVRATAVIFFTVFYAFSHNLCGLLGVNKIFAIVGDVVLSRGINFAEFRFNLVGVFENHRVSD